MKPSKQMMPQTISTFRQVNTVDGGGGNVITRTPILVNVAASIQPDSVPHAIVAGSMQEVKSWRIYIYAGQDVKPGDIVNNPDGGAGSASVMSVENLSGRNDVIMFLAMMERAVSV